MSNQDDSPEKQEPRKEGEEKKNVIKLGDLPPEVEEKIEKKTAEGDATKEGESRPSLRLSKSETPAAAEKSEESAPSSSAESKDSPPPPRSDEGSKLKLSRTQEAPAEKKEDKPAEPAAAEKIVEEKKEPVAETEPPTAKPVPPTETAAGPAAGAAAPKPAQTPPKMRPPIPKPVGAGRPRPPGAPPPPPKAATKKAATPTPAPVVDDSDKGKVSPAGVAIDVIAACVAVVFAYLLYTNY